MMRENLQVIGCAVAISLITGTSVWAADLGRPRQIFEDAPLVQSRSGLSVTVGVHGGATIANTEASVPGFGALDGIGSQGAIGGVHGGIDYIFRSGFFVGADASYSWQSTDTTLTIGGTTLAVDLDGTFAAHGRLGYDWGLFRAYALAGWRHTDVNWPSGWTGVPGSFSGLDLGIGTGVMLTKSVELGLEGIYTRYSDETTAGGITLSPDQLQALLKLNIRF